MASRAPSSAEDPPTPARRRVRGTLSRDRILAAAVRLVDAEVVQALSTRRLGRELGVEGMALYWYIRNKDDLLDGLIDTIWAETNPDIPPASGDWAEHMRVVMDSIRQMGLRHPHIFTLLADRPAPPNLQVRAQADVAVLRGAGFSEELAQYAVHTLFGHVFWHVIGEVRGYYAERRARRVRPTHKRLFRPGLEIIIAGLQALLERSDRGFGSERHDYLSS